MKKNIEKPNPRLAPNLTINSRYSVVFNTPVQEGEIPISHKTNNQSISI